MFCQNLAVGCCICDPLVGIDGAPEAGLSNIDEAAPKESVDCWPLAINSTTQLGVRPYVGSRF